MSQRFENKDGFALVAVLLFLLVVTAVITPFILAARTDFLLASNAHHKARQGHSAAGLANLIARQLASLDVEQNEKIALNSQPMRSLCGDKMIEIRVQDQLGIINLNLAPVELLRAGFAVLPQDEISAGELADLALAYRSPDAPAGGVDEKLLQDGLKRASFEVVEELYEFPGIPKMAVSELSAVFTTYGGRPAVNLDNAPKAVADSISSSGLARDPYVVTGEESRFYRVEVTIRSISDQSAGFAGNLIETEDNKSGRFITKEKTVVPGVISSVTDEFTANMDCEELLGDEVANWIAAQ
ncbi:MAG: hypothetical protein AB3N20_22490 [Rhizobiaceae bacterium]